LNDNASSVWGSSGFSAVFLLWGFCSICLLDFSKGSDYFFLAYSGILLGFDS
jgi:hypothetical protein